MRSVMSHGFGVVPNVTVPRSVFDRSHGHKSTFDAGLLIPVYVDEALPGDTFTMDANIFARLATPVFPIMDNMFMDLHFFFVPNRLLWQHWEMFCGEQKQEDWVDYTIPTLPAPAGGFPEGTLADYMGIPCGIEGIEVSALPFRAYNQIWNDWYRDENIQDTRWAGRDDGPDDYTSDYALQYRGKRKDYFTSCLPWPQKGASVDVPIGTSAPVSSATFDVTGKAGQAPQFTSAGAAWSAKLVGASGSALTNWDSAPGATYNPMYWGTPNLETTVTGLTADLSSATAATVNQLRTAFQIQKLLERDARSGSRYTEVVRAHFGVTSPDARLQRPEYLGGGTRPVNVSAIAQTSSTDGTSPQGNLAAMGTVSMSNIGFNKSFTEHGIILGLLSVRADLTYQQGIERMWSRQTRYDHYWPSLAHLGEQAVLNKEIYAQGTAGGTDDDDVFGYQERYAEYRYKPSRLSGAMRSTHSTPLDSWHLSQEFTSLPSLNNAFIIENPPLDRCVAVPGEPHFIMDSYFRLRCARPMPVFSIPGYIDHF